MSFQGPRTQELGNSVLMVLLIMKYPRRSVKLPKWEFVSLVTIVKIGSFWVRYRAQQVICAIFSKLWIVSNISLGHIRRCILKEKPTLSTGVGWGVSSVKDETVVWYSQLHPILLLYWLLGSNISCNACKTENKKKSKQYVVKFTFTFKETLEVTAQRKIWSQLFKMVDNSRGLGVYWIIYLWDSTIKLTFGQLESGLWLIFSYSYLSSRLRIIFYFILFFLFKKNSFNWKSVFGSLSLSPINDFILFYFSPRYTLLLEKADDKGKHIQMLGNILPEY